jgi:hypothetical protein
MPLSLGDFALAMQVTFPVPAAVTEKILKSLVTVVVASIVLGEMK